MLENAEANRHAPPTSIGSVSDGVRAGGLLFVGEPHSPDTAGDLAFETAHGLFVGLALADLAVVVPQSTDAVGPRGLARPPERPPDMGGCCCG